MKNPFAIFDLEPQFQLDIAILSDRYLALQKQLHPDNFANSSAQEQRLAMQQSADINEALQTLKNSISRAEAIIAIHIGERDLEQKSTQDMAFLMQQLEWREQLEQIENSKDDIALEDFRIEIEQSQKSLLNQIQQQLEQQNWQQAQVSVDKLRFVNKLIEQIEIVEDKLF